MEQSSDLEINQIMAKAKPKLSSKAYLKAWTDFKDFCKEEEPGEKQYISWFNHLRTQKKMASSTLWSVYSRLNYVHQSEFGVRLQQWPRITQLLKSYKGDPTKKAKVFTLFEIHAFLRKELSSPFWILRKAVVAVALCGGLRGQETNTIQFKDVKKTQEGFEITITRAKQRGENKQDLILVPFNKSDPAICFGSKLSNYLDSVSRVLGPFQPDDKLFKGCHSGIRFVNQPFGRNQLQKVGQDVAMELGLPDPEAYTGHCWRRSAASQAALAGASTTQLKKGFGWRSNDVALEYVDNTHAHTRQLAAMITGTSLPPSRQEVASSTLPEGSVHKGDYGTKIVNIQMGDNCTLNFY